MMNRPTTLITKHVILLNKFTSASPATQQLGLDFLAHTLERTDVQGRLLHVILKYTNMNWASNTTLILFQAKQKIAKHSQNNVIEKCKQSKCMRKGLK